MIPGKFVSVLPINSEWNHNMWIYTGQGIVLIYPWQWDSELTRVERDREREREGEGEREIAGAG